MDTKRIKEWIVQVVALMDHQEKDLIQEGMDIYADIAKTGPHANEDKYVQIGVTWVKLPLHKWHEINEHMKSQRNVSGVTPKIAAIHLLRDYILETYGYKPGLKDSKDCVENTEYFPAL